ncbi:MAG: TonB-dependent receptor [Kordiimonas sp.]
MTQFVPFIAMFALAPVFDVPAFAKETHVFDIQPSPIAQSLFKVAKQAGVSLSLPVLSFRDGKAPAIAGEYSTEQVLDILLADTAFSYSAVGDNSYQIYWRSIKSKSGLPNGLDEGHHNIEELVVTALRRPDFSHKLPYSISSYSPRSTQNLTTLDVADVAMRISGLTGIGQSNGLTKLTVRGISDGSFVGRAQSLVGVYFGGAQLSTNAAAPGLLLKDIERIEVLKGPQGTLYGSGALSGIFHVIAKKPDLEDGLFDADAMVAATKAGDMSYGASFVANLPIVEDKFALRMLGYNYESGGYIDDIRLKIKDVNSSQTYGARLSGLIKFSDSFSLTLGGTYQKTQADDQHYYRSKLGYLKRDNYLREPYKIGLSHTYLTVDWQSSWADLSSTSSYLFRDRESIFDASLIVPVFTTLPVTPSPFSRDNNYSIVSNETQLRSKSGGRLEWLLGSYYSHRRENSEDYLTVPGAGRERLNKSDIIHRELLKERQNEFSLFGEANYFLSKKIAVTSGVRAFFHDLKASSKLLDIGAEGVVETSRKRKKSGVSPKLVFAYHLGDNRLLYAATSYGYRLGGVNAAGNFSTAGGLGQITLLDVYKSDKLVNYELGYKHKSADNSLSYNMALYYIRWKDVQAFEYDSFGFPEVQNIGNARIFGGEFDFSIQPVSDFQLRGYVSYSGSKITETTRAFGALLGDRLPGAPKITAGLFPQYSFALNNKLRAQIEVDYSYSSDADVLFAKDTSPKIDSYHLVNMRISLLAGKFQYTAYANNLLNTDANVFGFGNPFNSPENADYTNILRPLQVGLKISSYF